MIPFKNVLWNKIFYPLKAAPLKIFLILGKLGFGLWMWKIYDFDNLNIQNMRFNY